MSEIKKLEHQYQCLCFYYQYKTTNTDTDYNAILLYQLFCGISRLDLKITNYIIEYKINLYCI